MSVLGLHRDQPLSEVIGLAVGRASVCWEPMDCTGIFDSTTASDIVDEVIDWIKINYNNNTEENE